MCNKTDCTKGWRDIATLVAAISLQKSGNDSLFKVPYDICSVPSVPVSCGIRVLLLTHTSQASMCVVAIIKMHNNVQ